MQSYLRLTLLGVFGAVGVGLAICLAMTSGLQTDDSAADAPLSPGGPADEDAPANTSPKATARPFLPALVGLKAKATDAGPILAPCHPAVADQIDQLDKMMQRADEISRRNQLAAADAESIVSKASGDIGSPPPASFAQHLPGGSADPDLAADPGMEGVLPTPGNTRGTETSESAQAHIRRRESDGALSVNIQDTDIREVLDVLSRQGGLNILASKSVQGRVAASLPNTDVETALDAILRSTGYVARREGNFIFVGTPEDFQNMDHAMDKVGTRVYRPNYVTAAELQTLIVPMLTPDIGTVSVSSAAEAGIPSNSPETGGNSFAGSDVLLVRDYNAILAQVDQVVDEVDRRPLQVAIEAMMLSVRLDDTNKFGINFRSLRDKNNVPLVSRSPRNSLAAINVGRGGINFGFLNSRMDVFLGALETIGDTNVIASPRLTCLNKQRAEIHIGREVGYITTMVTETAATECVEFLELGTQLRIRPFISDDGMIRMEVHPEISTGSVTVEGGLTIPGKDVTQVTTNVMIPDGSTAIIGGLIREDLGTTARQIPLLGSLRLIGPAFRRKTEDIERDEIIILITPRIVRDAEADCEGRQASFEFQERQAVYADKMSPIGKRFYGRRYYRLAEDAWAAGDARLALRYVNKSVRFDPLNRQATSLLGEILARNPCSGRSAHPLRFGPPPCDSSYGGGRLSTWLFDELGASAPGPPPPDEFHREQPGSVRSIAPPETR